MIDELKAVFEKMEDAAENVLRHGRAAGFMSALETVLLASSLLAVVAYVASYSWHFAFAGAGLAAASLAVSRMGDRHHREALKELYKLKKLIRVAALVIKLDDTIRKAEKAVEELEQELKKRGIVPQET